MIFFVNNILQSKKMKEKTTILNKEMIVDFHTTLPTS